MLKELQTNHKFIKDGIMSSETHNVIMLIDLKIRIILLPILNYICWSRIYIDRYLLWYILRLLFYIGKRSYFVMFLYMCSDKVVPVHESTAVWYCFSWIRHGITHLEQEITVWMKNKTSICYRCRDLASNCFRSDPPMMILFFLI